jgi:RNA polymerase sigma-70 factor, ECF subfamily
VIDDFRPRANYPIMCRVSHRGEYGHTLDAVVCGLSRRDPADTTQLVLAAQGGDEEAFRMLYREVQPRLLRYLRTIVGADAEDVAADAWLEIARGLRGFRGDLDAFRGWAATIARHRALDHLRRLRRRPTFDVPVEELTELAAADDTARGAIDAMSTDTAIALIATLPRDQAEAVMLRVVLGLDAQAAGKVLGKRPGAVRTAAHRGLRRLAEHLGRHADAASRHADAAGRHADAAGRRTGAGNSRERTVDLTPYTNRPGPHADPLRFDDGPTGERRIPSDTLRKR